MADPLSLPLERRLEDSILAWLRTPIGAGVDPDGRLERARELITSLQALRRDEDGPITPEEDKAKKPRLIVAATDEARTVAYAPIRNLTVRLVLRANALVAAGQVDPFLAESGALESLTDFLAGTWNEGSPVIDTANQIAVMLAVRRRGNGRYSDGDKRGEVYMLDVRAVGLEHTTT